MCIRDRPDDALAVSDACNRIVYPTHYNVVSIRELIAKNMPDYKVSDIKLAKSEMGEALMYYALTKAVSYTHLDVYKRQARNSVSVPDIQQKLSIDSYKLTGFNNRFLQHSLH